MASFISILHEITDAVKADEVLWTLLEGIDSFQDLPPEWKKRATGAKSGDSRGYVNMDFNTGGKDSKVQTVATSAKVKDVNQVINFMRKAISLTRDSDSAIAWVEFMGQPFVGIIKSHGSYGSVPEYKILVPSGGTSKGSREVKHWGTGKWDNRLGKYVPPSYSKYEKESLKPGEAADQMFYVVRDTVQAMYNALDDNGEKPKEWFDLLVGTPFTVKVLTSDANRQAVRAQRAAARGGPDVGGLDDNKKAALKKYVASKIDPLVDSVKTELQKVLDDALEGKGMDRRGNIDLSGVEDKLRKIGSVVSAMNSTLKSSNDKFTRETSWGTSPNVQANYRLDILLSSIKRALGEN